MKIIICANSHKKQHFNDDENTQRSELCGFTICRRQIGFLVDSFMSWKRRRNNTFVQFALYISHFNKNLNSVSFTFNLN